MTNNVLELPVGTLFPSLTLSLHPEGANVRSVSLIVRCGSGQFQQHVTGAGGFANLAHWPCAIRDSQLKKERFKQMRNQRQKKIL